VCLLHVKEIKKKPQALGVLPSEFAWRSKNEDYNVQIDLLLYRADNIVNICVIQYSKLPFVIDKDYEEKLRTKAEVFRQEILPHKAIHLLMFTVFGVKPNK
jgi:nitrogen regulatory protein PII-like uncharacterized protein